jgi:hypothetical protein
VSKDGDRRSSPVAKEYHWELAKNGTSNDHLELERSAAGQTEECGTTGTYNAKGKTESISRGSFERSGKKWLHVVWPLGWVRTFFLNPTRPDRQTPKPSPRAHDHSRGRTTCQPNRLKTRRLQPLKAPNRRQRRQERRRCMWRRRRRPWRRRKMSIFKKGSSMMAGHSRSGSRTPVLVQGSGSDRT